MPARDREAVEVRGGRLAGLGEVARDRDPARGAAAQRDGEDLGARELVKNASRLPMATSLMNGGPVVSVSSATSAPVRAS